MIFLLFLLVFSQNVFASNLLISVKDTLSGAMQNYVQHIGEFPIQKVVENNIIPALAIVALNIPIIKRRVNLQDKLKDFFSPLIETVGNLQNITITFPLRVVQLIVLPKFIKDTTSVHAWDGTPLKKVGKKEKFISECAKILGTVLFWPTKLQVYATKKMEYPIIRLYDNKTLSRNSGNNLYQIFQKAILESIRS